MIPDMKLLQMLHAGTLMLPVYGRPPVNCGEEFKIRAVRKNTGLKTKPDLTGYFLWQTVLWFIVAFTAITWVNHFRIVTSQQSQGRRKGAFCCEWSSLDGCAAPVWQGSWNICRKRPKKKPVFQLNITEWIVPVKFPAVLWELNAQHCCSARCCHKTSRIVQVIGRSSRKETPITKSTLPFWLYLPCPESAVLLGWTPERTTQGFDGVHSADAWNQLHTCTTYMQYFSRGNESNRRGAWKFCFLRLVLLVLQGEIHHVGSCFSLKIIYLLVNVPHWFIILSSPHSG